MLENWNRKRNLGLWMVLALSLLALIGCAGNDETSTDKGTNEEDSNQKATLAFSWSPASLDPHGSDSWEVMRSGTAETLIKLNEELEPTAWLAKSWKQESDTTWLFQLQENVTFHNGKAMDATSVKESLQRSMDKNQRAKDLLQIKSMGVVSDTELKIETTQPNAALIAHLADPSTIIVDVATMDAKDSYPAFTGAFKIKKFNQDESLIVKRYEDYWGEKALLSEVTIKFIADANTRLMALQSGDVDGATDISVDNIDVLEKNKKFEVLTATSLRTHMLMYNMESPLFKELALRKVVDMLIPREEIVSSVMKGQGTVAHSAFSPVLPFGKVENKEEKQSVDQLMQQEGWKKNATGMWEKEGKPFEATLLTFPQRPELTVMAEVIQNKLLVEGMKVNIRQVENIDDTLANEDWDLSMYSMLTAHTGDPQFFLEIFYRSNSESNVSKYASPSVDKMISQLSQTTDLEERNQLAIQIQEKINEDIPQSFIVFPNTVFAVKDGLKGFVAHPIEYYYNHSQIDVE
ncbi:ABC transporter substrate-binding protein [Peribacillus sp. Hz7]|uniref:ABC transporter substrate-binding protein n=1 Tax=Peribacillus sp. Hz7 TaxID=3344873 RepID=UPI0035CBDB5F